MIKKEQKNWNSKEIFELRNALLTRKRDETLASVAMRLLKNPLFVKRSYDSVRHKLGRIRDSEQ